MAARRRSAEEWRTLVSEWQGSGLDAESYARARGLNVSTLRWWRWRLGSAPPTSPAFVEVQIHEPAPPDLVVEVGDLRVRVPAGFDARELRRLLVALC